MTDEAAPEAEQTAVPALHLVESSPGEEAAELTVEETVEPGAAAAPEASANLTITIIADGAGHIFKGTLIGGIEQTYAEGESLTLPADVAQAHIDRGFAVEA